MSSWLICPFFYKTAAIIGTKEKKGGYIKGDGYIFSWCVGHLAGLA